MSDVTLARAPAGAQSLFMRLAHLTEKLPDLGFIGVLIPVLCVIGLVYLASMVSVVLAWFVALFCLTLTVLYAYVIVRDTPPDITASHPPPKSS